MTIKNFKRDAVFKFSKMSKFFLIYARLLYQISFTSANYQHQMFQILGASYFYKPKFPIESLID